MKPVLHSFAYGFDFLREQVADVSSPDMVAQPNGIRNHPAWVIGHVTHVCQMVGVVLGLPEWLPADWSARYATGSTPTAEADLFDPKDVLLEALRDAQARITVAVERLNDAQLDAAFPDPAYRDVFPSIRHFLTQVLVGHSAYHIGQLSVWRRAMALPPVGRSFE